MLNEKSSFHTRARARRPAAQSGHAIAESTPHTATANQAAATTERCHLVPTALPKHSRDVRIRYASSALRIRQLTNAIAIPPIASFSDPPRIVAGRRLGTRHGATRRFRREVELLCNIAIQFDRTNDRRVAGSFDPKRVLLVVA